MLVRTHMQTFACTHMHAHTHEHACTRAHAHTHTHTCTHTHTHTHTLLSLISVIWRIFSSFKCCIGSIFAAMLQVWRGP